LENKKLPDFSDEIGIGDFQTLNFIGFREFLLRCPRLDEDFETERQKDSPRIFIFRIWEQWIPAFAGMTGGSQL
jgi:hypothetical protein